jgi:hypothetical protein
MVFFQFTAPVTLAAVYLGFPRRPGPAFGLTCPALLFGTLPDFAGLLGPASFKTFASPLILLAAVLLFVRLGNSMEIVPTRTGH